MVQSRVSDRIQVILSNKGIKVKGGQGYFLPSFFIEKTFRFFLSLMVYKISLK